MPELPDIVTYLRALEPRVVGQPLEALRLASPFVLRSVDPPVRELTGKRVLGLSRLGVPACDPDVNRDGNVDQDDLLYLVNVTGGGPNPTGIDADFNRDGNVDQDDVAALIEVIAGGPCP